MRSSPRRIIFAIACLAVPTLLAGSVFADTYTSYAVSVNNSGDVLNVGLTDLGVLVTQNLSDPNFTYTVFTPPSTFTTSVTAPMLAYDNGTPCALSVSGFTGITQGRCNGSREVFQGIGPGGSGLYLIESGLPAQKLYSGFGGVGDILLNGVGDVAFVGIGGRGDTNYLLYDTTSHISPEPSSFAMLGTGVAGLAGALRRRLRRA